MPDPMQPDLWGELPPALEPPRVVNVRPHTRVLPGRAVAKKDKPSVPRKRSRTAGGSPSAIAAAVALTEWKSLALACVGWCAKHLESFTADEVWARLAEYPDAGTHEPAALGPVFLKAAKAGWIVKSGQTRRSTMTQRHRELTVWSSTIYEGPPE